MSDSLKTEGIFALITKNLPVGFSIVDNTGLIIEFNRAAEEITGFSRQEVDNRLLVFFAVGKCRNQM